MPLLPQHISETFVTNTFDSALNKFGDIRRIPDIYEWMRAVLIPGLTMNLDAEVWPDGDGSFGLAGATPYSTTDLLYRMNQFSVLDGVIFRK